ncbi:MAG: hypothetical protein U0P81_06905 [Holophagaceae bacterium]
MSFLKNLFHRAPEAPLPTLEALASERGLALDLPGLAALLPDFEHQGPEGRKAWADAVKACVDRGWPLPPAFEEALEDLWPEIVPLWTAHRDGFKFWPFAEGLATRARVGAQPVPEAWATLWGVRIEDVLERAVEHLREASRTPFERLPSGIYRSPQGDGHDAARLLLPELWEDIFPKQNLFVGLPSPGELYVAPQVLLPKLAEAVDRSLGSTAAGHRLVYTLYQRVEGKFVPANLQDPHPIAQTQRQLRQTDYVMALEAQKEVLAALGGRAAPVGILPHPNTGRTFTVATWKGDMPCFLPETDLVAFQDAAGAPLGIYHRSTFPRVPTLKGVDVDIWGPRRVRFDAFPTAGQLDLLERFADAEQMAALSKGGTPARRPAPAGRPGPPPPGQAPAAAPPPPHLKDVKLGAQED